MACTTLGISQIKKLILVKYIYSMNPLYLIVGNASGYIEEKDLNTLHLNIDHASGYIKEKSLNKYLLFDSTDENEELLKKY